MPTYHRTCILTSLHTFIPTFLHSYIPTCPHTYIPSFLHTYIPSFLHTYKPAILRVQFEKCSTPGYSRGAFVGAGPPESTLSLSWADLEVVDVIPWPGFPYGLGHCMMRGILWATGLPGFFPLTERTRQFGLIDAPLPDRSDHFASVGSSAGRMLGVEGSPPTQECRQIVSYPHFCEVSKKLQYFE